MTTEIQYLDELKSKLKDCDSLTEKKDYLKDELDYLSVIFLEQRRLIKLQTFLFYGLRLIIFIKMMIEMKLLEL